jgi:hypothetical protein
MRTILVFIITYAVSAYNVYRIALVSRRTRNNNMKSSLSVTCGIWVVFSSIPLFFINKMTATTI